MIGRLLRGLSGNSARHAPSIPPGERVYAIGDVHGRVDLLDMLLESIGHDDASRDPARTTLVFLGDLVDRGPDSAKVVRRVRSLCDAGHARLLKGNHEEVFIEAARGNARSARALFKIGGMATITSYGITRAEAEHGGLEDLVALLAARIPVADVDFLDVAEDMIEIGDYLFVHAGIRPGVPLPAQRESDLRWIREPFLTSTKKHGPMVIHGHTITESVDLRPNRIGIDTGGFVTGVLTAIGLEGSDRWFIEARGAPSDNFEAFGGRWTQ